MSADAPLKIGDVAKLAGTTTRTIRYYEEIGLLPAAGGREPGAHRTYSQADVDRLTEVMRLRTLLGVSLDGLKDLVEAEDNSEALRREWHEGVPDPVRRRESATRAGPAMALMPSSWPRSRRPVYGRRSKRIARP